MRSFFLLSLFLIFGSSAQAMTCKSFIKSLPKEEQESRLKSIPGQWLDNECVVKLSKKCLEARAADGDGASWGDATCKDGEPVEMANSRKEATQACKDHGGVEEYNPPACPFMECDECK